MTIRVHIQLDDGEKIANFPNNVTADYINNKVRATYGRERGTLSATAEETNIVVDLVGDSDYFFLESIPVPTTPAGIGSRVYEYISGLWLRFFPIRRCNFSVPIDSLVPLDITDGCPFPVGLEPVVTDAMETIREIIDKTTGTGGVYRKQPLVLCRCPRGGKTTTLVEIFKKVKEEGWNCLMTTYNGTSNFQRLDNEGHVESLFRLITNQLDPSLGTEERRQIDWDLLDRYIGDHPFVLFIDEINTLSREIHRDMGIILMTYFLDKKNRYLVMTSHIPLEHCPAGIRGLWSPSLSAVSDRSLLFLSMPTSYSVAELATMDSKSRCRGITRSKASFYAGIPSLMYVVSVQKGEDPVRRFNRAIPSRSSNKTQFRSFLYSLLSGVVDSLLEEYFCFVGGVCDDPILGLRIQWPLCYALCIINRYCDAFQEAKHLSQCLQTLLHDTDTTGDGMSWEQMTRLAILIRFILVSMSSSNETSTTKLAPFGLCETDDEGRGAAVEVTAFGEGVKIATQKFLLDYARQCEKNTFVLFVARFEQFDGVCAFIHTDHRVIRVAGYQCKDSREGANGKVPAWMTANGHLLRSKAPDATRPAGRVDPNGWMKYNKEETKSFLGLSLQLPLNW